MTLSRPMLALSGLLLGAGCAPAEVPEAAVDTVTLTEEVGELEIDQASFAPVTVIATDRSDVAVTATVVGVARLQHERHGERLILTHTCDYPANDVRMESPCYVRFEAEVPRSLGGLFISAETSDIDIDAGDLGSLTVATGNSAVTIAAGTTGDLDVSFEGPGALSLDVAHADTANIIAANTEMHVTLGESPNVYLQRSVGDGHVALGTAPESLVIDPGGPTGSFDIDLPRGAYAIRTHPDAHLHLDGVTNEPGAAHEIELVSAGSVSLVGR